MQLPALVGIAPGEAGSSKVPTSQEVPVFKAYGPIHERYFRETGKQVLLVMLAFTSFIRRKVYTPSSDCDSLPRPYGSSYFRTLHPWGEISGSLLRLAVNLPLWSLPLT